MTSLTNLQLAAAIAHAGPGAELTLRCGGGSIVTVGRHPAADMTPCQFRAVMVAMLPDAEHGVAHERPVDPTARIVDVEVGGALVDLGGGVARSRTLCGLEQRWIASTLPWAEMYDLLDDAGPEGLPDDAMNATVKPDEELGTTVLVISANDRRYQATLDCVAADVAGRVMAAEMIRSCQIEAGATDPALPTESTPRRESER